jgi:glycosyltransferase involved in cell wall biosynthesis
MRSMIMHIITSFTGSAGAETMLARLLRISVDDRILVVPLVGVSERNRDLTNNPRVNYAPLGVNSRLGMIGATIKLSRMIATERPRVILCWMYHAMTVGTIAQRIAGTNTPVFWNVRQSLEDPTSLSRNTRMALRLGRLLSGVPSGIIYNSKRALELHGKYGYSNRNAIVIPNGFDIPKGVSIAVKAPRIFGIAGRFHPQKDHETFFYAASIVARANPQARFLAVGSGLTSENPAVTELMNKAGIPVASVDLCGESNDMSTFYRSIDVLVLSSRTEGFPNVVAEAMSHGKPVITTDVGDAAMIVSNTGWVVPPRNPASLAAVMERVLKMQPKRYADMANQARQRVAAEYDLQAICQRYEKFLNV